MIRNIKRYTSDYATNRLIVNREMSTGLMKLWWKFRVWLA